MLIARKKFVTSRIDCSLNSPKKVTFLSDTTSFAHLQVVIHSVQSPCEIVSVSVCIYRIDNACACFFFIRPDRSPPVHYAETSMKNGFGLKYIHKFLNLPFLLLQVSYCSLVL